MTKEIELNGEIIRETTVKELKKGDFFTKKPLTSPKDSQVWVKDEYCHVSKKWACYNFSDVNKYCYIPGDKLIYTDFIF